MLNYVNDPPAGPRCVYLDDLMASELSRLENHIKSLTLQRDELYRWKQEKIAKDLSWTEKCVAHVMLWQAYPYGSPKYTIKLTGDAPTVTGFLLFDVAVAPSLNPGIVEKITYTTKSTFMSTGDWFQEPKTLGHSEKHDPRFETSSETCLVNFLKQTKFKEVTFDREKCELLCQIRDVIDSEYK